ELLVGGSQHFVRSDHIATGRHRSYLRERAQSTELAGEVQDMYGDRARTVPAAKLGDHGGQRGRYAGSRTPDDRDVAARTIEIEQERLWLAGSEAIEQPHGKLKGGPDA